MALTTVAIVKARLGIPTANTAQDALLTTIVEEASDILINYLGYNPESGTYTEYYMGNGRRALVLDNKPVRSITSIHVDPSGCYGFGDTPFDTENLLVAGTDYVLDYKSSTDYSESGIVYRIGTVWPSLTIDNPGLLTYSGAPSLGNIKVVYVAGYATLPARYQAWATKFACWKFATDVDGVVKTSESHSDTSYSYSLGDLKGMSQDAVLASITGGAKEWVV